MRKISFILVLMIFMLTGCSKTENKSKDFSTDFGLPEYILVYNKGTQSKIDKGSEKYNQIIKILDEQVKKEKKFGFVESKIKNNDNENELKQKETTLEFIYYELSSYPSTAESGQIKKPFIKLLWTLTGKNVDVLELGLNSGFAPYGSGAVGNLSKDIAAKVLEVIK